jgi:hypothetical protein
MASAAAEAVDGLKMVEKKSPRSQDEGLLEGGFPASRGGPMAVLSLGFRQQAAGGRRPPAIDRRALTLIELLVAVATVAGLVCLLTPAVQAVREAGRRVECQNNLRQLSAACLAFEAAHGHFPSGGWGWDWVGDPDRGSGRSQPGGWAYSILPFMEAGSVHELPRDGKPRVITPRQRRGAARAIATAVNGFNCPSRRGSTAFPLRRFMFNSDRPMNMQAGKSDYAINAGDGAAEGPAGHGRGEGPPPQALMSIGTYPWWWREGVSRRPEDHLSGLSFVCSAVRPADVTDGLAHTYLIGEKYLDPGAVDTGTDPGDNENYLAGFNNDSSRSTRRPPLLDQPGAAHPDRYGSAHPEAMAMAYGDGSVRPVAYTVSPEVHRSAGHRRDGF